MASSSSGDDGPSTTGGRSERQQLWGLVPPVMAETNGNNLALRNLLLVMMNFETASTMKYADERRGTGPEDAALAVAALEGPKSKRDEPLRVAMLVQGYGSNPNATDSDGATPLFSAIQCEGPQAAVEYLISSDADPKETTNYGVTPLYCAAGQGANVDPICQDGEAQLQVAAHHGHARTVELLLKHNANVPLLEEHRTFADGDAALWEKEYAHALKCYTTALKLGNSHAAVYAKRSLCRLYNCDQQSFWSASSVCKMALYCGIFCLMMKLSFGNLSPTLLCAYDCSIADILRLFSDETGFSPTFPYFHGLPVTDRKMVRLIDIIKEMEVSNKATICLDESDDGTEKQSLKSVQGGIGSIRAWCLKYGLHFDVSRICGHNLMIYTTPFGGTFYLTIEYLKRSITLLLEGRSLYIRGWRDGLHGPFEIALGDEVQYMLGDVTVINISENYRFLSPDMEVGKTWMGPGALRDSFEKLYKCQGEGSRLIKRAVGIFAVHIAEAARIQRVYKAERRSFLTYYQPTLDSTVEGSSRSVPLEKKSSFWVNDYGHYCEQSMIDTERRLAGKASPGIKNRKDANIRTSAEIFKEIRIILRDACTEGAKEKKPPMVEDPDDYYNRMKFSEELKAGSKRPRTSQERRGQSKKPRLDEFAEGVGDEGPHLFAYLLEDWYPEADKEIKEDEEIKEEEDDKEEEEGVGDEGPHLFAYLLEDWYPEADKEIEEDEEIKEEEDDKEEEKEEAEEKEVKEEADDEEEVKEEADGGKKEEQAGAYYEDFLNHFPAIRKFTEKMQNQLRSVQRITSSMDVVSSVQRMASKQDTLLSVRAQITSTRSKVLPQRCSLPQRTSRALLQPSLLRAGRLVTRILRFL